MVFIMQKDQINVNEHGHKPSRKLLDQISDRLRVKGYSPRTEEAYRDWAKRYVLFFDKHYPKEMGIVKKRGTASEKPPRCWRSA